MTKIILFRIAMVIGFGLFVYLGIFALVGELTSSANQASYLQSNPYHYRFSSPYPSTSPYVQGRNHLNDHPRIPASPFVIGGNDIDDELGLYTAYSWYLWYSLTGVMGEYPH